MAELDPLFLALQEAVAGRYSLERELGRGGMGVVFLARDVSLDRLVAIKLLPPALAARPALRERFLREARLAARLSHPNLVPIHSVEEHGSLVWFAMAFVPGESLGARLRARGSLPPGETARLLRDVAWALGYAHAQGVVHRDVKPDNILLEAGGRRALIADFGIAAPAEQGGEVMGTVAYLSPEQATGDRVDGRSDLYALGVVGYYALSARLPYPVTSLGALIERQLAGTAPPLAEAAPHVPRALSRTIDRCLAPLPSARFQTGEQLAAALEQVGSLDGDLPVPLRVWLAKGEQQRLPTLLASLLLGMPAMVAAVVMAFSGAMVPNQWSLFLSLLGVLAVPWGIHLGGRLLQTRRVLAAGYHRGDLVRALELHVERRKEELQFEFGGQATLAGTILRRAVQGSFGLSLGAIGLGFILAPGDRAGILIGGGLLGITASAVMQWIKNFVPGAHLHPTDRGAELARTIWKSRLGGWLARVAGWRLKRRGAPEQALHRPTELALGDAADALYQALPAAERRELKQLPDQIKHLSDQAQHMRARIEELDDLIAKAAPSTLFEGEKAAGDGGAGALGEARALWATRLRETVTMLEALRLGLLKLHAGSATPDTLTEELAAAHELRERLGLLLAGQAEADQSLKAGDQ